LFAIARHASGGSVHEERGLMFTTAPDPRAFFANAAARLSPAIAADDVLDAAAEFFGPLGRGCILMPRLRGDEPLVEAAIKRGASPMPAQPALAIQVPPTGNDPPGLVLEELTDAGMLGACADVVRRSFGPTVEPDPDDGAPYFSDPALLDDVRRAIVLARLDGEIVGTANVFVTHRVAWVTQVGTLASYRGRGIGEATSRWATTRGFELGAQAAWLTASPLGEPVYRRMGFEQFGTFSTAWLPPPVTSTAC
jgi:GNAT superfamily N-acetyltransferase